MNSPIKNTIPARERLIFALDVPDLDEALKIAKKTAPYMDWLEVGSILATNAGIKAVEKLRELYPDKVDC